MISQPSAKNSDDLFTTAFNWLCTHLYAEAYSAFLSIEKESNNAALNFNLALCTMKAGEMQQAMNYIEKAMMQVRKAPLAITTNSVYDKLMALQNDTDYYSLPMDKDYAEQFPQNAEQRILRLAVDIYFNMKLWNKVRQIASILKNKNYKNVNDALEVNEK